MQRLYNSGEFGTFFASLSASFIGLSVCLSLALSFSQLHCYYASIATWDLPVPRLIHMDDLIHPHCVSNLLGKHTYVQHFDHFHCSSCFPLL